MKLQHLAVIFVIIMLPIALVLSQYIQNQIDTITMQTQYTASLNNATHDALKAFQINSVNNKYSNISDSKIRDIEASISTFYNSLGTSMNQYVSSKEELSLFIPAIVFTLYDGYYIHSTYNNIYSTTAEGRVSLHDTDGDSSNDNNYQTGLKPYIYYSCTYDLDGSSSTITDRVVINYTLDNSITIYGTLKDTDGVKRYLSKSGYLIDYTKVSEINSTNKTLKYDGVLIEPERLTEHLLIVTEDGNVEAGDYNYIVYNNKKVYQDVNASGSANGKYFWYDNYTKTYLQSELAGLKEYINSNGVGFKSINAFEYYVEAYNFSEWLVNQSGLKNLTQNNIVQSDGKVGAFTEKGELYLSVNTDNLGTGVTKKIFDVKGNNNDPMLSGSTFNAHREAVIRKSIETNLLTVIANYNIQSASTYQFVLPVIEEDNWYNIVNNVSVIAFMQGLPISQKYYNNYSVITNTRNEEVVNEQSIYVLTEIGNNIEYHQPGCEYLLENQDKVSGVYTSLSFLRQTVKVNEANIHYFYPQARKNKTMTGCYNCIVNATGNYDIDEIISGKIIDEEGNVKDISKNKARKAYLTGIARERYNLYRTSEIY